MNQVASTGTFSLLVWMNLQMVVILPAHIGSESFMKGICDSSHCHSDVVFKATLAQISQKFLQPMPFLLQGKAHAQELLSSDQPHIILNLLSTFQDEQVSLNEANRLLSLCFANMDRLLGRCRLTLNRERIQSIQPLDSPWQLSPEPMPLRVMEVTPNVDITFRPLSRLKIKMERGDERVHAWELGIDVRTVDIKRYCTLLDHAVGSLLVEFERKEVELGV